VSEGHIRRLRQYDGLARAVVGGIERETFVLEMPNADLLAGNEANASAVRRAMFETGYWVERRELEATVSTVIGALQEQWRPKPPPRLPRERRPSARRSQFLDDWLEKRQTGDPADRWVADDEEPNYNEEDET
jgi:hypothetical protein